MPRKRKAPNGMGSIRKRADGRWEGQYTAGFNYSNGKLIRKSVYGKSQAEVAKKLAEKLAEVDGNIEMNTEIDPSKTSVGEWLNLWVDEYCVHLKPLTLVSYRSIIRNYLEPGLGKLMLGKLSNIRIQKLYNSIDVSSKTLKNIHGVLHKALKQAVAIGCLKNNPSDGCILPKLEAKEIELLDSSGIALVLKAIEGNEHENELITALFSGLRISELIALSWDCIDFEKGEITVYRQLLRIKEPGTSVRYEFGPTKNSKKRIVAASPFVLGVLEKQMQKIEQMATKADSAWHNKDNLVFTDATGSHKTQPALYKQVKKTAAEIGQPGLHFHSLRHSFATASIFAGDDIKSVSSNLGHSTISITLNTYGHYTDEARRKSAMLMQSYIESSLKSGNEEHDEH
ncbi:MAG: site-specific integrase [Eubacteriaceae bacterium]|nr:site-specific integrase [Eubacteriaceae bacterium]